MGRMETRKPQSDKRFCSSIRYGSSIACEKQCRVSDIYIAKMAYGTDIIKY